MVTVHLQGGLGNQLFQLSFLEYLQKTSGRGAFLRTLESPITGHSPEQYFETIFRDWRYMYDGSRRESTYVHEHPKMVEQEWPPQDACYVGYFQRHEYCDLVKEAFVAKLHFDRRVLQRHRDTSTKTFVHVRGGDYVGNRLHAVPLRAYYERCVDLTPLKSLVVFTNDLAYARGLIPEIVECAQVIEESEVDTLLLMSRCGACICANSSLSWWGAYLNADRPVFMPSRWFTDITLEGAYYFPGVTVVDVEPTAAV